MIATRPSDFKPPALRTERGFVGALNVPLHPLQSVESPVTPQIVVNTPSVGDHKTQQEVFIKLGFSLTHLVFCNVDIILSYMCKLTDGGVGYGEVVSGDQRACETKLSACKSQFSVAA